MKRFTIATLLLTITMGLSGCASLTDSVISCEMGVRNCVLAQKAWGHWSWVYCDLDHPTHFARGFKAGYRDILSGGNGCQPTLPPKCYWKPQFQCPEGQCKTHAWFDGFSHGALAAKQDGYGDLGQIPISPRARANLEAARRPRQSNDIYGGAGGVYYGDAISNDGGIIELAPPVTSEAGTMLEETPAIPGESSTTTPVRPYE